MENRNDQDKNQAGQQGQQGQQATPGEGQTGSDQGAFGTGGGTSFSQGQTDQLDKDKERTDELGSDKGVVGTSKEKDTSETLVETGETDFAETGQGATESRTGSASNEDIETGTTPTRDAALDDGS